jgi:hypothetical protein
VRWILLATLSGCWTVGQLQHDSIKHDQHADIHAQLGDGLRAARDQQLSVSEEVAARLLYQKRSRYWESEVLMH